MPPPSQKNEDEEEEEEIDEEEEENENNDNENPNPPKVIKKTVVYKIFAHFLSEIGAKLTKLAYKEVGFASSQNLPDVRLHDTVREGP